jgi:hypothetical protein
MRLSTIVLIVSVGVAVAGFGLVMAGFAVLASANLDTVQASVAAGDRIDTFMRIGAPCLFGGVFGGWALVSLTRWAESRNLRRKATINGVATILAVSDTGVTINSNPRVRLRLQVQPADGSQSYVADLTMTVSRLAIPRPGQVLAIRYDPENPKHLTPVGWAAQAAGG